MSDLALINPLNPEDPAALSWPATLPIEVAMRTATPKAICEAYNLSREDWDALKGNPMFVADVAAAVTALKSDGMSFKMKARLQAEELLKRSWTLIHDKTGLTPPAVQADLIKFTIKAAGLDASNEKASAVNAPTLNIQINL